MRLIRFCLNFQKKSKHYKNKKPHCLMKYFKTKPLIIQDCIDFTFIFSKNKTDIKQKPHY
ncbi:hypothetical protein FLJC2902T_31530 [Flavobacterium limnosediminis JC2902]|uniref:Uncharacterized protein n=1 Tax=Flavobacterium limnosediminis JC2902 TaxID=1341181 RepID=V6SLR2_9FLAO|nr:hypothetical protein FLJC2902T_31530 [Flavobacterium limnosediminis JC2902]